MTQRTWWSIGLVTSALCLAAADPAQARAGATPRFAAIVIHADSEDCDMLGADGANITPPGKLWHSATNKTRSNMICKAKVLNPDGVNVTFLPAGRPCELYAPGEGKGGTTILTYDWSETVSSSGNASLNCHFKE